MPRQSSLIFLRTLKICLLATHGKISLTLSFLLQTNGHSLFNITYCLPVCLRACTLACLPACPSTCPSIVCFDLWTFYFLILLLSFISRRHQHQHPSVHPLSDGWTDWLCWQMSGGLRSCLFIHYLSLFHIRPFIWYFLL